MAQSPVTSLDACKNIYLVGIKGVAMTALAQCLLDMGKLVEGSDVTEDFVTKDLLDTFHIHVKNGFHESNISPQYQLVIYTGAHHGSQNPEVIRAKQLGIQTLSHAEALGLLMQGKRSISVCGVGGKTTTSAMIAWILKFAQMDPSYAIGVGNVPNLKRTGRLVSKSAWFVAEADEYATDPGRDNTPRFLHQSPEIIVCTNIKHDHPDIYPTFADTLQAYSKFFAKLPETGTLIISSEQTNEERKLFEQFEKQHPRVLLRTPPLEKTNTADGKTSTRFIFQGISYALELSVPGRFNAVNGLMALLAAHKAGVRIEASLEALAQFRGTMRRFENRGNTQGIQRYDDYAHHPDEISATLHALKDWHPTSKRIVLFQPHTYSRTKKLLNEFSQCFTDADDVYLLDIFASAREQPDDTISSDALVDLLQSRGVQAKNLNTLHQAAHFLKTYLKQGDVFMTIGAGDLYHIHDMLQ